MPYSFNSREEREEAYNTIFDDAESASKEFMEDNLDGLFDTIDNYVSTMATDDVRYKVALPDFKSKTGAFMAWMVGEKGMSIDEASKMFDGDQPGAEELVQEFGMFLMEHSVLLGTDGSLTTMEYNKGLVAPDRAVKIREMFIKASAKFEEYKIPDIDYSNPKEVKKMAPQMVMIKALCNEALIQVKEYSDLPYKFKDTDEKVMDAVEKAITRKKMPRSYDSFTKIIGNGKAPKDIKSDLNKLTDKYDYFYNRVKDPYSSRADVAPLSTTLAHRTILNDYRGKTLIQAEPGLRNISRRSEKIGTLMDLEYEITDNRILRKLKGEEDEILGEIVNECNQKFDYTLKSKARSLAYDKDRDAEKNRKYKESQKPENLDEEFKLVGEIKADIIQARVSELIDNAKKYEISDGDKELLRELKSTLSEYGNIIKNANTKNDLKMFAGKSEELKDIYRPLNYVHHSPENYENVTGYKNLQDSLGKIKLIHDTFEIGGKLNDDGSETREEPIPPEITEVLGQIDKMCEADAHFLDGIRDLNVTAMSLPQLKKVYTKNNPDIKLDRMKLEEAVKKQKPKTIAELDKIDKEVAPKVNEKDYQTSLKINNQINVLKYIDGMKKEVDATGKLTYNQLVDMLAARAVICAQRNKKRGLNKETSSLAIAEMAEKIQDMYLIKNFYNNCKSDPKMMKELIDNFQSGHGGAVEDMIKKHSNLITTNKLNGDPKVLERFVTTPKERIKAFQEEFSKNGGDKPAFAMEIILMRNVAEAGRKDSSNLKQPLNAEMLAEARRQDALLRNDKVMPAICTGVPDAKFGELLTRGNGGKFVEQVRRIADTNRFGKIEGITEVVEKNTIVGKYKSINKEIKACEKATQDLFKDVKAGKITREDFNKQLNGYFTELVAQSIVASDMITAAKATKTQKELRVDLNKKEFNEKVKTLMNSEDFKKNYKTMMEPDNIPKEFSLDSVAKQYNVAREKNAEAARKAAEAKALKEAQNDVKKKVGKQLADRLKEQKPLGPMGF